MQTRLLQKQRRFFLTTLVCFFCICINAQNGMWTWMHGSSTPNPSPNYGTQGVAASTNHPPGLYEACEWTDLQGNFWIYGGNSGSENTALWKFEPATNLWTWMRGSQLVAQAGNYGTQGIPSPTNDPGSRAWGTITWTDQVGDLWMFGGYGYDSNGNIGALSDLWRYNIATNTWTWMKGASTTNDPGSYGTLQTTATSNLPPARNETSTSWTNTDGTLWLYGGLGLWGPFNDMWKYDVATNNWTWMSGSNTGNTPPNWGTLQVAASSNTPGSRASYSKWIDDCGQFWLFGGLTPLGFTLADMWMYNTTTNLWTWMAGSTVLNDTSTFQSYCQYTNAHPAGRYESRACWKDASGRFWQYGGDLSLTHYNDLWVFDPAINQFAWIGGASQNNSNPGNYGVQLVPAATNYPDPSMGSVGFQGSNGDLWMFGGYGAFGRMNTVWRYQPDTLCPATSTTGAQFTSNPNSGCVPLNVNVAPTQNNAQTQYLWNFGDPSTLADTSHQTTSSYTYTTSGTYTVTLVVQQGSGACPQRDSSSQSIAIHALPQVQLGNDTTICASQPFVVHANIPNANYQWSTLETSESINIAASGNYWVLVIDSNGCEGHDSILIAIESGVNINPPNVFTPNSDGWNDVYDPSDSTSIAYSINIYNRWGRLVFKSDDGSEKWDGTYQGKACADGVYYWILTYPDCIGEENNITGFVHLIRE